MLTDISLPSDSHIAWAVLAFLRSRWATGAEVRREGWSEDSSTAALCAGLRAFLGDTMRVDVEYADQIPLEASGKYRFSISNLAAQA